MYQTENPTILYRKQRTLKEPAQFSGIGIHTGKQVTMRFVPAQEGTGIVFQRTDLPNCPVIPATVEYVRDTNRCTTLGFADVRIHTVEHVLAAIKAYDIDNLRIEVSDIEPPVGNGSSDLFVEMIEKAGIEEQVDDVPIYKLKTPVYWSDKQIHLVALPYDGFRISYTLQYPESELLRAQYQSILINSENFKREIASCRTFSLYEELSTLIDKGLIRGGSLANAVVIKAEPDGDVVFSKDGLFFPDEMVRHKILDVVGDLALTGLSFHAHIIAIRTGHAATVDFAKILLTHITTENT